MGLIKCILYMVNISLISASSSESDWKGAYLTVDPELFAQWRELNPSLMADTDTSSNLFEDVASSVEENLYPQGIENVLGFLNHKSDVRPLRRALILFGILHDLGLLQDVRVVVPERFDLNALKNQRPKHAEVFTVACFQLALARPGSLAWRLLKQIAQRANLPISKLSELVGKTAFRADLDWFNSLFPV